MSIIFSLVLSLIFSININSTDFGPSIYKEGPCRALRGLIIDHTHREDGPQELMRLFNITDTISYLEFKNNYKTAKQTAESYDYIVLSGSSKINALNPDLDAEKRFLRDTRTPVIGICLGHQIIAEAYNYRPTSIVVKFDDLKAGWKDELLRKSSQQITSGPLLLKGRKLRFYHGYYVEDLPSSTFICHQENIDLATGEKYVAIMEHRYKKVFSTQGHPEYTDKETMDSQLGKDLIATIFAKWFKSTCPRARYAPKWTTTPNCQVTYVCPDQPPYPVLSLDTFYTNKVFDIESPLDRDPKGKDESNTSEGSLSEVPSTRTNLEETSSNRPRSFLEILNSFRFLEKL